MDPIQISPTKYSAFPEQVSVDYTKNVLTVFNVVKNFINDSSTPVIRVLKAAAVIPAALILTVVTICLVCLGLLLHLFLLPVALYSSGWSFDTFRNFFTSAANEMFSFSISLFTWFFDHESLPPSKKDHSKPAILMANGYLHNSSAWHYFRDELEEEGQCGAIYSVNLPSPFSCMEDFAKIIYTKMLQIVKETGNSEIILVGHSMGGIAASYTAISMDELRKDEDPSVDVLQVITLGSPMQGTYFSKIGLGKCARQMERSAPFLKELQKKIKLAKTTQFMHLGSSMDMVVRPTNAALLKPEEHIITHEFNNCGHLTFLYSETVVKCVSEQIQKFSTNSAD